MSPPRSRPFRSRLRSRVSVVIACEPWLEPREALEGLAGLPASERRKVGEILVSRGLNPGLQRNRAAAAARGDWLWFLDRDARPDPGCLEALLAGAREGKADVAGGPDLPPPGETPGGLDSDAALGSFFGSLECRHRYRAAGAPGPCGEGRLIGCNLLARRTVFRATGGFREDLFPNEENEWLERAQRSGARLWRVPAAAVRRPRPATGLSLAAKAYAYGRGRARQWRAAGGGIAAAVRLAPLVLPALWGACAWAATRGGALAEAAGVLPVAYLLGCLAAARAAGRSRAWPRFVLLHHGYAGGLLAGLLSPAARLGADAEVRRLPFSALA